MVGSRNLLIGLRLRCAVRSLRQCTYNSAPREIDLEVIVAKALGFTQHDIGCEGKDFGIGGLPAQGGFGVGVSPRLMRDATERQPCIANRAIVQVKCRGDGYQRKSIGQPVADLEIGVVPVEGGPGQFDGGNDFLWIEVGIALRRVAGKAMEVSYPYLVSLSRARRVDRQHVAWR